MKANQKNILIVKNRAMGDSVMGLSSVQYLRELYPESNLFYGVPKWVAPLYEGCDFDFEILPIELGTLGDWFRLWRKLRSLKIDHIHEMHQSGRTKKFFRLYSLFNRVPYTYHNHALDIKSEVVDQNKLGPLIGRDLNGVFSFLGKEKRPSYLDYPPKMVVSVKKRNRVILGVVATRATKMWPLEYFVELAEKLKARDPEVEIMIPLGPGDQEIGKKLEELGIERFAEVVRWPLDLLARELASSELYIGNDTGLKHICVALGVKTYTFFGPELPLEWHPYDESAHPFFFIEGLSCRTRTAHFCGLSECDSMACLKDIEVGKVIGIIDLF